jgi:glycosyltransferase involved in cell wall biosynthesis
MVFDVPADSGGVLSILHDFYEEVRSFADTSIEWYFVLGKPDLPETENIRVLRFPWVKKSWLHRLYFDYFVAPGLIRKHSVERVFSLQNIIVPRTDVLQTVYIQQPLPFSEHSFSFLKSRLFWTYQNIIGKLIKHSILQADKVIVQTEWMKKVVGRTGVPASKVHVLPPRIPGVPKAYFKPSEQAFSTFFYPASPFLYKNHQLIIDACRILKDQGYVNYRIFFTLDGSEDAHAARLLKKARRNSLPIEFLGPLSREDVFSLYTDSVLLFPSYIETFGLPMLEARLHKGFILASDCPFSHEILDGYENVRFFDPFDAHALASLMRDVMTGKAEYTSECSSLPETTREMSMVELLLQ